MLIVVNHFKKCVKAFFSATDTTKNVSSLLPKFFFSRHGSPWVLIYYNGLNFILKVVKKLSNLFGSCPNFAGP